AALNPLNRQTVSLLQSKRQKTLRVETAALQNPGHNSDRSNPVDVIVTIQDDSLAAIDCRQKPVNRRFQSGEQERICQRGQLRAQESLNHSAIRRSAPGDDWV